MPDLEDSPSQIKTKLKAEFKTVGTRPKSPLESFDGIVVLSAEETDISGENKERLLAGLSLMVKIKTGGNFIFLGTKIHNAGAENYILQNHPDIEANFPAKRKEASTRTQIKDLSAFLHKKPLSKLLIVSQAYHIPRIDRYCQRYMPDQLYDVSPVGDIKSYAKQVEVEINKIIKYAGQGDLDLFLTHN